MLSNYLAEILGITMVVVSLALLIKESYLRKIFSCIENEGCMLACGIVSFVAGLAMVLAHNIWVKNWQVLITILGWIFLIRGLTMLFLPEKTKIIVKKIESANWLSMALVVILFIGLIITYFGFTA